MDGHGHWGNRGPLIFTPLTVNRATPVLEIASILPAPIARPGRPLPPLSAVRSPPRLPYRAAAATLRGATPPGIRIGREHTWAR